MKTIFRHRENQPVVWHHEPPEKSNQCCLYCGNFLGDGIVPSNKEHLIGLHFVPDGSFAGGTAFNFLFRACTRCNTKKSEVERHLSSVTLINSPARATENAVDAVAVRKASKDIHPTKRIPVADAWQETTVQGKFGALSLSFGLLAPPQPVHRYVNELACRHIQGLFSLITSPNPADRNGTLLLPPDRVSILGHYHHGDWGNPQLLELVRRTRDWPAFATIRTANGFFQAEMRRQEDPDGEWFWALEWNKSLRIAGAISLASPPRVLGGLPPLTWKQADAASRYRQESPLARGEDRLFCFHDPKDEIEDTPEN